MELPGPWPDGFYVGNFTGVPMYFVAYDANQLALGPLQVPPLIESPATDPQATNRLGNGWFLPSDVIGRTDRIYVLAFFDTPEFKPPPAIDIKQSTSGGGGSISIFGFGGGVSVSVTEFYSAPAAAAVMVLGKTDRGTFEPPLIASGLEVRTDQVDPKHPLVLAYHDFNNGMMMGADQYSVPTIRGVLRLEDEAVTAVKAASVEVAI